MVTPPLAAKFSEYASSNMLAISCRSTYVSNTIDSVQQHHDRSNNCQDKWTLTVWSHEKAGGAPLLIKCIARPSDRATLIGSTIPNMRDSSIQFNTSLKIAEIRTGAFYFLQRNVKFWVLFFQTFNRKYVSHVTTGVSFEHVLSNTC